MAIFQNRSRTVARAALVLAGALVVSDAVAQNSAPSADAAAPADKLKISAAYRHRLEIWDFFEPSGAGGVNNNYQFYGSDLRVKAVWTDEWFDAFGELQGVLLAGLPSNAVGGPTEGPLGGGAVYRAHNANDDVDYNGYIRQGGLRLKKLGVPGLSISGGRQIFAEGKEAVPTEASMAWVQNQRVSERLIGPFDFTYPGRSFDSAQLTYNRGPMNVTGFYGKPTQGGFNINGMDQIDNINLGYASFNLTQPEWSKNTAARLFYIYYDDDRPVLKVDNRPQPDRAADTGNIAIHTIGADVVQLVPTVAGPIDLMGWFAYQAGDWGTLDHSAWSLALEAGIQPSALPWKPWFRVGYNQGSGDDDASDGDHETFFQILPTPRQYSWSTFYNLMNSQDFFAQVILRPIAGLTWRTDVHVLRLSENDDLWYFGGGATRELRNPGFGFAARPSGGQTSLMEVLETQLSYNWNDYVTTTVYYGHGFGEDVVDADFTNSDANYGFLELTLKLPPM